MPPDRVSGGTGSPSVEGFDLALSEETDLGPAPYPAPYGDTWGGDSPGPLRAALPGSGRPGQIKFRKKDPSDPTGYSTDLVDCGTFFPLFVCRRTEAHRGGRAVVTGAEERCEHRDCPLCAGPHTRSTCPRGLPHLGGLWADGEGTTTAERWEGFLRAKGYRRPLRQVIVSAPPGTFDPSDDHGRVIAEVRHRAESRVRVWSWVTPYPGASVVVHLWRGCYGEGYNKWGPHAHVLCLGIYVRNTAAYERRTGWVVKQATADGTKYTPFVGYRYQKLLRHLVYELGHAAILPDRPAIVWVGPVRKWKPADDEQEPTEGERPHCPECRERMEHWEDLGLNLVRSLEGWGMWWVGCDGRQFLPVRLLGAGPPGGDSRE